MKPLVVFLAFSLATDLYAQSDIASKVTDAFKHGDAASLSGYFMETVEMTLLLEDGAYSKSEAKNRLNTFFNQYPPRDFIVRHQGTSKSDDQYRIGELITSLETFRVTFFLKKAGDTMKIKELKIEFTNRH